MKMEKDADYVAAGFPKGIIGEGESIVHIDLFRYSSFFNAKEAWDRRCKRIDFERLFCIMPIYSHEDRAVFKSIDVYGKVGLTPNPELRDENLVFLPRYKVTIEKNCRRSGYAFPRYYRNCEYLFHGLDILKMLNNEDDFVLEY